jgi:4-carboxymuconolactone decarboxylase
MTAQIYEGPRLPPLPESSYDDAQKAALEDFKQTRKVGFSGPWHVFIRSPELLTHAQRMGEYLRYRCKLSGRLSELTILLVAREWTQHYEHGTHRGHALKAGVAPATIDAIIEGRRPEGLAEDEQIVWDSLHEFLEFHDVCEMVPKLPPHFGFAAFHKTADKRTGSGVNGEADHFLLFASSSLL